MLLNHNLPKQSQIVISKANDLANKQNSKTSAEEELKTAKENDAKKASEISALTN